MRILLLGATGMVGQGALRECLAATEVSEVVAIVRSPLEYPPSAKLTELVRTDFYRWDDIDLSRFNGCLFCLGVSAVGKTESEYRHITFDLTLSLAKSLVKASPQASFVYVSGVGTNTRGGQMWARVKGKTEDALQTMPFRGVYCFRPGYIQPLHGIRSKVGWYNGIYTALSWAEPLLMRLAPGLVTTTENVGRAMLTVVRDGWPKPVLGSRDINAAAMQWPASQAGTDLRS